MFEPDLKVKDLMTTNVITIGMDDTLKTARMHFNRRRFHHLIVVENGRPVGVLSDRDLLRNLSPFIGVRFSERPQDLMTLTKKVHQIMTRRLISTHPDAPIAEAAERMMQERVSCLPVIDPEQGLVGIITSGDLVRLVVRQERLATITT